MSLPLGVTFDAFTDFGFWTSVGILAGTYVLFTLGLQLNVGYTGIVNFGQAGFMAIGAYAMGVLVVKAHWSFWLALPTAVFVAIGFGLLVGLPSLRLRADYFAIATIAAAEIVRITALNLRDVTGGNQGLFGFDDSWNNLADQIDTWLRQLGWSDPESLFPLFIVVWVTALIATVLLHFATKSPWGRVLRAVREDEDAARALGKNTLAYKLQSLAIAATLGALAGFFVAINLNFLTPEAFLPAFTFIGFAVLVLGGLASYWGVAAGAIIMWTILEGTRFIDLPLSAEREAAVRFMIVGLVLILLMAFRPQGMFGKKEEMVLGD
jgi:branched-chain amino acid transport system permease protein